MERPKFIVTSAEFKHSVEYSIELVIGNNPPAPFKRGIVTLYKPKEFFGKMELATVNWSAIGAVEPDLAEAFAKAILEAAKMATVLNKQVKLEGK